MLREEWQSSNLRILEGYCLYFTGDVEVIHCLRDSFSSGMFVKKKSCSHVAMLFFIGKIISSLEYLQPSILSTVLYIFLTFTAYSIFTVMFFLQSSFFTRVLSFFQNSSCKWPICQVYISVGQLLASSVTRVTFLLTPGTSIEFIILLNSHFFKTDFFEAATFSEQRLF